MAVLVRYGTLDDERVSSDVMDEKRQENTAYEYLCHLEETKVWMQACINDLLPPATELEEELRNGVYLAKLAHFVAPALVPINKIYDLDQSIYRSRGLQFRHTENINHWFSAMKAVGMPSSCHPETFDIYDKRNMPRAIHCLHAFSMFLFKKGLAPKIEDLLGKVTFTAEEISAMQKELDKYGVQMPSFNKIGGVLPSELPLDVAALHASIIVINKTMEKKNSKFLESLQNPKAHLSSVVNEYVERYKQGMAYSRKVKIQNSRRAEKPNYVSDVYDELLTQEELQQCIDEVNEIEALDTLDIALTKADAQTTMKILKSPHLKLLEVEPSNKAVYLQLLLAEREATIENNNPVFLSRAEVQRIILQGNGKAMEEMNIKEIIVTLNQAIENDDLQKTVECLKDKRAQLPSIIEDARELYHKEFFVMKLAKQCDLTYEDVYGGIKILTAIAAINLAVEKEDSHSTLNALQSPIVHLTGVQPVCREVYLDVLRNAWEAKNSEEGMQFLTRNDIQASVDFSNTIWEEQQAKEIALAAINVAVSNGDAEEVLQSLMNPAASIFSINSSHAVLYLKVLQDAQQLHSTLSLTVIQQEINATNKQAYEANRIAIADIAINKLRDIIEPAIIKFQSHVRHYFQEKEKERRFDYFVQNESEIVKLQKWWRSHMEESRRLELRCVAAHTIQAFVRKWLEEKRHRDRMEIFKANEEKVRKFQCYWRAKQHLKSLRMANPHLAEVWERISVLINSTRDNVEEIEFHKVRADVVQTIRKNKDLERRVNDMDVKIGLIVRNRITSDEFSKEGRKASLNKRDSVELRDSRRSTIHRGLRALNRDSRNLLESYQHLFYALQTDPRYLARLIFAMSPGHSFKFIESVIYTLFNYGSTPREEYLLFVLFKYALEEEFRCKIDKVSDVSSGNTLLFNMVINYNRSGCGQSNLRQLLEGPVSNILQKKALYLGADPVEIYKRWINKQETETGVMSSLPCDVLPQEALKFPQVVEEMDNNLKRLKLEALIFIDAICYSVENIPYGMRYIAQLLCKNLRKKFPGISEEDTLKSVGNLIYYRYIKPAIATPDVYEIVILQPGETISAEQRKNLGSIAKVLHMAAVFKIFEPGEKLAAINNFILESQKKFRKLFLEVCAVEEPQDHFNISMYTEETLMAPPTVCLTLQEILNTHELLCTHEESVAPDPSDKLHGLLRDIGKPETVQSLTGHAGDSVRNSSKSEVCLFLTNKFSVDSGSPTIDRLFVETKRMVVHLLQCQPPRVTFLEDGTQCANVLYTIKCAPSEAEQKAYTELHNYSTFFQKDIIIPILKRVPMLSEFKEVLIGNLQRLELAKYVKQENLYQELVDALHEDLSHNTEYRQKRREDIRKLKDALTQLEKKTEFYQSKLEYYENYMKNCLDAMNPTKKITRRLTLGSSQEACPMKKRYTAHKLIEKGIIQEFNTSAVETRAVVFEIGPSGNAGIFDVTVKLGATEVYSTNINIQHLLQKQYEGETVIEMFGNAKVNINLLLHLLNTKFF